MHETHPAANATAVQTERHSLSASRYQPINGFIATLALLVASGVIFAGSLQISSLVSTELTSQQVFFPPPSSAVYRDPGVGGILRPVAGEQVTDGGLAQLYGEDYLGYLMEHVADGKTYTQVASEAAAHPHDAHLAAEVATLFRYLTLRSMLLEAYAFATFASMFEVCAILIFVTAVFVGAFTIRRRLQD